MGQQVDWQLKKDSVLSRNSYMFNNSLISDVTFVVYSEKTGLKVLIPAHKYVLATSSPVFFAMFYGDLAVVGDTVDLPDCDAEGFLEFLRYIYCEMIELSLPTAIQALYLSKKYLVPPLAKICVGYLKRNITPVYALDAIPYVVKLDEQELLEKCLQVIDVNTDIVFSSRSFLDVSEDLLESILSRNSLCVREIDLFKAVQLWLSHNMNLGSRIASRKGRPQSSALQNESPGSPIKRAYNGMCTCRCQERCDCVTVVLESSRAPRDGMECSYVEKFDLKVETLSVTKAQESGADRFIATETESRRQQISTFDQNQTLNSLPLPCSKLANACNRLLKKVRFPTMTEEEFRQFVMPTNLLFQQDVIDILVNFGPVQSKLERFLSTPRNGALRRCSRYNTTSRWFLYSGKKAEIFRLSVNTPIKLYGLRLYGFENCSYKVKLEVYPRLTPSEKQRKEGFYKCESRGADSYHGYDVILDRSLRIENDAEYQIEAVIEGAPSTYGKEGQRFIQCGNVKFDFRGEENSVFENFGVGQFAEVIFFEL